MTMIKVCVPKEKLTCLGKYYDNIADPKEEETMTGDTNEWNTIPISHKWDKTKPMVADIASSSFDQGRRAPVKNISLLTLSIR